MKTRKVCSDCHEQKVLDQFYKDHSCKGGHRHQCKSCHVARYRDKQKVYEANNRAKKQKYSGKYYLKNKQKKLIYEKKRRTTNLEYKLAGRLRTRLSTAIKNGQKLGLR